MKANLVYIFIYFLIFTACSTDENREETIPEEEGFSKEIFFSEYIEGTSFNKALEIVNLTGKTIDLENERFSIKKQSNGSGEWMSNFPLSGLINHGKVFVVANERADDPGILNNADQLKTGSPMDFNGNDPIGLFRDDVLIDVIGQVDDVTDFAKDVSLRRKYEVNEPSLTFDADEWKEFEMNNTEDLGNY